MVQTLESTRIHFTTTHYILYVRKIQDLLLDSLCLVYAYILKEVTTLLLVVRMLELTNVTNCLKRKVF